MRLPWKKNTNSATAYRGWKIRTDGIEAMKKLQSISVFLPQWHKEDEKIKTVVLKDVLIFNGM